RKRDDLRRNPLPFGLYEDANDEHSNGCVVNAAFNRAAAPGKKPMAYLDDLFSVAGKKALVTGAATGIGRMAATALVQGGADVMIASRKGADCERVAGELTQT